MITRRDCSDLQHTRRGQWTFEQHAYCSHDTGAVCVSESPQWQSKGNIQRSTFKEETLRRVVLGGFWFYSETFIGWKQNKNFLSVRENTFLLDYEVAHLQSVCIRASSVFYSNRCAWGLGQSRCTAPSPGARLIQSHLFCWFTGV